MQPLLNERQKTAERLTRELSALVATVTSVLPLGSDQNLRFWVSDYGKKEVLQALKDAGYTPEFLGMRPQVDIKSYSMGLVNCFEILIPQERQAVPEFDGRHHGELAKPKVIDPEMEGMRKYLGLGPKK